MGRCFERLKLLEFGYRDGVVSQFNGFILEAYPAMLIPETESIALLPGPLTNQASRPILPTFV
jgi:hypothetical protein